MKAKYLLVAIVLLYAVGSCKKDEYKNLDCSTVSAKYGDNIKPIIISSCTQSSCHEQGSSNGDFTTYAGLKEKVDNGSLEKRVLYDKNMPLTGALPLSERKKIKCWIENGAPDN
jgi:hypothetical protein